MGLVILMYAAEEMIGVDKLPDVITLTDDVLPETIPGDAPVVLMAK